MRNPLHSLNARQIVLAAITGTVIASALVLQHGVLPAYDEWQLFQAKADQQAAEFARLSRNLAVRESVEEVFRKLGPEACQTASDEVTFSQFLRDLEAIRRAPSLTVVNAKPLPVVDAGAYKTYRLRLSVAGKLLELVKFLSELTGSKMPVGVEGFTLRGVQGASMVECSFTVRMVALVDMSKGDGNALKVGATALAR